MKKAYLFLFPFFCLPMLSFAQFNLVGDAVSTGPDCFRLTRDTNFVSGAVWNLNLVDISDPFEAYFDVFLGCNNASGADGMAFVLQPVSTTVGGTGAGLGYQGISPSLVLEFDTYQNTGFNDPASDHLAIMANGNPIHSPPQNLAGPTPAKVNFLGLAVNVEDCNWHSVRISWTPADSTLRVWFDCVLRLSYTGNVVSSIFNNNPNVFWGFTAATGVQTNEQAICLNYVSFTEGLTDTTICQGDTVQLDAGTGNAFSWTPTAGLSASNIRNPRAFPAVTTLYRVAVTDPCGNIRRDSVLITVDNPADLVFSLGIDTILCQGNTLTLTPTRNQTYLWQDSSLQATFTTDSASWYWAEYSNACGTARDSQRVDVELLPVVDLGPDSLLCGVPSYLLDATFTSNTAFGTSYLWQNASTAATFTATASGQYWVEVSNFCGSVRDTVNLGFAPVPLAVTLGADTLLCPGDTLLLSVAQPVGVNYLWQNGSNSDTFVVRNTGQYYVVASNLCGTESDTVNVTYQAPPTVALGADTLLCYPDTLILDAGATPGALYLWSTLDTVSSVVVRDTGNYWVVVTNTCGDFATDSIRVDFLATPLVDLGPDQVLCAGQSVVLDLTSPTATAYQWIGGPATPTYTVSASGTYIGQASNQCGTTSDTIDVLILPALSISLGADTTLCRPDTLVLDVGFRPGDRFLWSTGDTVQSIVVRDTGLYWVFVRDTCGSLASDTIRVDYLSAPPIDLGADTTLCTGQTLLLDITTPTATFYQWLGGPAAPLYLINTAGTYIGQVGNVCGVNADTLIVSMAAAPSVALGPDTILCGNDSLLLNVFTPGATYLWNDGLTDSARTIRTAGMYWVEVRTFCGTDRDSLQVDVQTVPTKPDLGPPDTTLCDGATMRLEATSGSGVFFRWSDGSTLPFLLVSTPGLYWVEAYNDCGIERDSIEVFASQAPRVDLGEDLFLCEGETAVLEATQAVPAGYLWQDGSQADTFVVLENGQYWVSVFNACGADGDSVQVIFDRAPDEIDLGPDLTACEGDTLMLEATGISSPTAPVSYLWSTGEVEPIIFPLTTGNYTVTLSNRCGEVQDAVMIAFETPPTPDLGGDTSICYENFQPFILDVTEPGASYRWQDGSTIPFYSVQKAGIYLVEVSNSCGVSSDTLLVEEIDCNCQVYAPNAFSPNDDGHNDVFQVFTACRVVNAQFQVFDRWGKLIYSVSSLDEPWDGRYKGQHVGEGVYVWVLSFQGEGNRGTFSQKISGTVTLIR